MSEQKTIFPTTELMGSFLAKTCQESADVHNGFTANPKDWLFTHANIGLEDRVAVKAVANTKTQIALCLPYYETLEPHIQSYPMHDKDLDSVAGGEILGILIFIFGSIGAAAGFGSAGAVAAAATAGSIAACTAGVAAAATASVAAGAVITAGAVAGGAAVAGAVGAGVAVGTRNNNGK